MGPSQDIIDNNWVNIQNNSTSTLTLDNITAMGIYHERIGTNANRSMTITEFTVLPEPSTYAALLGVLALGLVAYRRRR